MTTTIKFGTDGWRGVVAEDYTFDNVRRCAQGFASYRDKKGKGGRKPEYFDMLRSDLLGRCRQSRSYTTTNLNTTITRSTRCLQANR